MNDRTDRIALLERRLDTHRKLAWVAVSILTGAGLLGAQAPTDEPVETLRARRIELVDESGRVLLALRQRQPGEGEEDARASAEIVLGKPEARSGLVLSEEGIRSSHGFSIGDVEGAPFVHVDTVNRRLQLSGHEQGGAIGSGQGEIGADYIQLGRGGTTLSAMPLASRAGHRGGRLKIGGGEKAPIVIESTTGADGRDVGSVTIHQGDERILWLTSWEDQGFVELAGKGFSRHLRVND